MINYVDAALSFQDSNFDKDIAVKLKQKLDEDPELNNPSVTKPDLNDPDSKLYFI